MDTPNIDKLFSEVCALRNEAESWRTENARLKRELAQKQESWDKAANYRDRALDLVKQCDEKSQRIKELCAENKELEERINAGYADANYHMNALNRLAAFLKPDDLTSEGVVDAAINQITFLTAERDGLRRWKDEAMMVDKQIMSIDSYVRNHNEATIGDSVWHLVGKWLVERDYLKRKLTEIKNLIP